MTEASTSAMSLVEGGTAAAAIAQEPAVSKQSEVLPLALSGSDILARAKTGSGKTQSYGLPILQKILLAKKSVSKGDLHYQVTRAVILVPTRELSEQVTSQLGALLPFLKRSIDEADLILSYGHDESLRALLASTSLPKSVQCLCMSATMTQDIKALKGLVLKRAVVLDIPDPPTSTLTQYTVAVSSATDKFLLTYVILRLRLIRGKCIIFVNDIDRCYRLKLFLEQFGVKSTVLNEELPVNSRYHIVQEFNKGVYDYIIATDESRFGADAAGSERALRRSEQPRQARKPRAKRARKRRANRGLSLPDGGRLRSVTKKAIREARIREIKMEILNSDRLKSHFEDNPTDLQYLRHDKVLHPTRVQNHLKHIPTYLMPRIRGSKTAQIAADEQGPEEQTEGAKRKRVGDEGGIGIVSFGSKRSRDAGVRGRGRGRGRGGSRGGKRSDPLRKFGK
ncbi:hypothetical protein L7F22_063415 [Adiantum nelumboides]|nr:hypothetical protein [Adiantum nelumboides]